MTDSANWREQVLADLVPGLAPVTLAADPDRLLLDEDLLAETRARGFELLTWEDPVAFRLAHETRRQTVSGDGGGDDGGGVALLLRFDRDDFSAVPYDLLQTGRPLRFNLSDLFPGLSYPVIASLDRSDLDAVHRARTEHRSKELGENATRDFVLHHVFGVRLPEISRPAELLHALLRRHCAGRRLPRLLDDRLVESLRCNPAFDCWPLDSIVPHREAFFSFLQERWPAFLDGRAGGAATAARDGKAAPGLKLDGPRALPFGAADVRPYVESLFLEGRLSPVRHHAGTERREDWVAVGIRSDPEEDRLRRLEKLLGHLGSMIPQVGARHPDWLAFAWPWAELSVLWWAAPAKARQELSGGLVNLRSRVDESFLAWVESRYAGLHNQPPDPPAMVHHLPRYLARRIEDAPEGKVALVVLDGLALDQWLLLRGVLEDQRPDLGFRSGAVFAWAPTITSVSRQALFAGRPPFCFESHLHTTEKENLLWRRFWAENDLNEHEVAYLRDRGDGRIDKLRESTSSPGLRVLGIVVHKVDDIMHGMELGASGMHNQVRQWAEEGVPSALVDTLLDSGFVVFLASDHGNIETTGIGRPADGALADTRGKRARLYSDATLRDRVLEQFPDAVAWPGPGLPHDCYPLLAPGRSAFAPAGERTVGHGGISLEELVVPFIEIEKSAE